MQHGVFQAASAALMVAASGVAFAQPGPMLDAPLVEPPAADESGYAEVNGLEMYYETHGEGAPLVMLHGGFMATGALGPIVPALADSRQVIAVDLQAHGRTADIDRPLSYEAMADDVAGVIAALGHEEADVLGYSMGGGVALRMAIQHPEAVRRLIIVSAPHESAGWYPEVSAGMVATDAEAMVGTIMHRAYVAVAPEPDHWAVFVDKMRVFMQGAYDWSAEIGAIGAPVLLVRGDADFVRPDSLEETFALLGGEAINRMEGELPSVQLAVLPATNHYTILTRTDLLVPIISGFLEE